MAIQLGILSSLKISLNVSSPQTTEHSFTMICNFIHYCI